MNYLKTAMSACASILVLFSAVSAHAESPPPVEDRSTLRTPTAAETTGKAADGTPNSGGGNPLSSGFNSLTGGFFSSPPEVGPEVPGVQQGAAGCPTDYESVAKVDPKVEKEPGGLNCARAGIGQYVDAVIATGSGIYKVAGAKEIMAIHQEYQKDWSSCQKAQSAAATVCIADNSDALADGITLINGLLSAGGAASVYDKCTTFGKAMDIGQKALAAYTAACTVMRQPCVLFCGDVKGALVKLDAAIKKATSSTLCEPLVPVPDNTSGAATTACNLAHSDATKSLSKVESAIKAELDVGNIKSTGGKLTRCDRKYWQNVASAGIGIMQLANSLKGGEKCKKESSATDVAAVAPETCSIPANANLPECICKANPRTPGCSNGLSGVGELSAGSGQVVAGKGLVADAAVGPIGGTDSTGIPQGEKNPGAGGGGGVGAPTGGGSSLGSIGGGSGSPSEKGAGKGGSGLNADILSGAGGGGGGGGYGGYRGGDDSSGGKGLRNYLPGGAKDPTRGLAGQAAGSKEVTGQAGKSNWEKVRDRYIDNKSSLIGN